MSRSALAILCFFSIVSLLLYAETASPQAKSDAPGQAPDQAALLEAADWIARQPYVETEYRYVMTCRLHFLLFWAGRDDVGGGYVRIGKAAGHAHEQMIQVLFGSDPANAPLGINRWGAGTEVLRSNDSGQPQASAFLGFMKSSKGQSLLAMRREISREQSNGTHLFEGIISRVDEQRALSTTIPYASNSDFDFHQYPEAQQAALQQLEHNPTRHIRTLEGAARTDCPRTGQFLSTTLQLMDDALAGHSTPYALCYIYAARHYKATLVSVHPVGTLKVRVALHEGGKSLDRTYHHLLEAHFEVLNQTTLVTSAFEILMGTEGSLRGAPIQITYQPNWWFQVVLNLLADSAQSHPAGTPPH